jgi:hypothetical protein
MPYIRADGKMVEKRSWIRVSLISDIIWGVIDFFGLLFSTLIDPTKAVPKRKGGSMRDNSGGGTYLYININV